MDYRQMIVSELNTAQRLLERFISQPENMSSIEEAARQIAVSIAGGGKVISCGNGGSMCDAMHFTEELTGRYREDRKPLPALAISDVSHLSCTANDFGYEKVFARTVEALGKEGDVLLALSTSGRSPSVIEAVSAAIKKGMTTIALTGETGGVLADLSTIAIRVPHSGYADRIQEIHMKIIHIMILLVEKMTE